jgi:SAM-dependent methyltransferase
MDPPARYDRVADLYDRVVGDDVTDPATAALLHLVPTAHGARVLDLACGQGRVARELARRGARVMGIDVSSRLLRLARQTERRAPIGITYLKADAARADVLAGETFEGVVCNFGLSDIDDLDGVLATAARVLPNGGWLVFSILHPCFPGWDDDAPSSWPPDRGYYTEGWWLAANTGFRGKVGATHRMLATYLNAMASHGFHLERAEEPEPGEVWAARAPDRAAVPVYLAARYRKLTAERAPRARAARSARG